MKHITKLLAIVLSAVIYATVSTGPASAATPGWTNLWSPRAQGYTFRGSSVAACKKPTTPGRYDVDVLFTRSDWRAVSANIVWAQRSDWSGWTGSTSSSSSWLYDSMQVHRVYNLTSDGFIQGRIRYNDNSMEYFVERYDVGKEVRYLEYCPGHDPR